MEIDAARVGALSIVIPAYNESARLGDTLTRLIDYLAHWPHDHEILVVDDGSSDNTAALAQDLLSSSAVPHQVLTGRGNRGKGYSVKEGALAARHDWTLITDADLSTPIEDVEALFAVALQNNLDIAAGSRGLPESDIGVRQSRIRQSMGRTFNRLVRGLTGLPLKDTQCGFKLWRTATLAPLWPRMAIDGFAWDVEMLILAQRAGLSMGEVPVRWNNAEGSKVSIVGDSLQMLRDVIKVRFSR